MAWKFSVTEAAAAAAAAAAALSSIHLSSSCGISSSSRLMSAWAYPACPSKGAAAAAASEYIVQTKEQLQVKLAIYIYTDKQVKDGKKGHCSKSNLSQAGLKRSERSTNH